MTSVLVVDDAVLFQAGLTSALGGAGLDVVGEAQDAMAAVAKASQLQPDIVVLDVLMPGISGLDVVDKIILAAPKTKVVLLTSSESGEDLLAAIRSGAMGYIVKTTPLPELVAGIEAVVHGGAVVSPAMLGKLFGTVAQLLRHKDVISARKPALTGREVEVLQFIARGLTSREIGERLYISENTVKNHVRNILDKLGLHSRGEAVMYALREELISME
ncbi:MAG: response regulator transcription factor [Acidimicrobiia bacterium]|nr:response regulator transcription factor [Acidimicrobiia bacterium]